MGTTKLQWQRMGCGRGMQASSGKKDKENQEMEDEMALQQDGKTKPRSCATGVDEWDISQESVNSADM